MNFKNWVNFFLWFMVKIKNRKVPENDIVHICYKNLIKSHKKILYFMLGMNFGSDSSLKMLICQIPIVAQKIGKSPLKLEKNYLCLRKNLEN